MEEKEKTMADSIPATTETHLAYCAQGAKIIEAALAKAQRADPTDAPFGLFGEEAALWHRAQAEAYQHALEMMAPASADPTEEQLRATIAATEKVLARQGS
jgi:hypothetical protein